MLQLKCEFVYIGYINIWLTLYNNKNIVHVHATHGNLIYNIHMTKVSVDNILEDFNFNIKDKNLSEDMVVGVELAIAEGISRAGDINDGMKLYERIVEINPKILTNLSNSLVPEIKILATELFKNNCFANALIQYNRLMHLVPMGEEDCKNVAICLSKLGQKDAAEKFVNRYLKLAENKTEAEYVASDILFFNLNMPEKAISHLEKYLHKEKGNALAYNTMGHLYSTCYQDKKLNEQLNCFMNANKLRPNTKTYLSNIAFTYNRLDEAEKAKEVYEKIQRLNPTHDDYFAYACFLIQHGDFKNGYRMLKHRFLKENGKKAVYPTILPPDKKINYDLDMDLSDKILLVHHEQGLGDSIMYFRFVKQLAKKAKEVYYVVPESLVKLFKNSCDNIKIHSDKLDIADLKYDYHIPIMDLPVLLKTEPENMPDADGYLTVYDGDVLDYKNKFIGDNCKFKIGISYRAFKDTENPDRDIPLECLAPLLEYENVEIYSLQKTKEDGILEEFSPDKKVIDLGKDFADFYDTACAIKNMDLVVTSDNVILNLAGALGVKTFGLFNRYADYRWYKLTGDDVGWYNSVKPFRAINMDNWDNCVNKAVRELELLL